MTLEQKIKKATFEVALKRSLHLAKKKPQRAARNLVEMASSMTKITFSGEQEAKIHETLTSLIESADEEANLRYLERLFRLTDEVF